MEDQQKRIDELERRLRDAPGQPVPPDTKMAELELRLKEMETRSEKAGPADAARGELIVGKSRLKFYGFLRMDAIYDDSRPNNTHTIGWIRSEDDSAPPTIGAPDDAADLTFHPRLTRFGLDLDGPTISGLGDAKVNGKLEIDFYNNSLQPQFESRAAIRMRHAYTKLAWGDFNVLAGQTSDVISPIWPIVNADLVMWGAGNLGDRRPQIRPEWTPAIGDSRLIVQGEVGLTGAQDGSDIDPAGSTGTGYRDGETSGLPTVQGRVALRVPVGDKEKKQNLEVGVWGHRAWEDPDIQIDGRDKFDSYAAGLDLTLPIVGDVLWVKGEAWVGTNLDDVRGGIFQGINTVLGEEIASKGGWAEVGVRPIGWYNLSVGYSMDDPDNNDLNAGGRAANKIWYVANRFNFDPIEFGIDYMNWTTKYVGFGDGDDNRIQAFVTYKF